MIKDLLSPLKGKHVCALIILAQDGSPITFLFSAVLTYLDAYYPFAWYGKVFSCRFLLNFYFHVQLEMVDFTLTLCNFLCHISWLESPLFDPSVMSYPPFIILHTLWCNFLFHHLLFIFALSLGNKCKAALTFKKIITQLSYRLWFSFVLFWTDESLVGSFFLISLNNINAVKLNFMLVIPEKLFLSIIRGLPLLLLKMTTCYY